MTLKKTDLQQKETEVINELIQVVTQLSSIKTTTPILIQHLIRRQQELEKALEEIRYNIPHSREL